MKKFILISLALIFSITSRAQIYSSTEVQTMRITTISKYLNSNDCTLTKNVYDNETTYMINRPAYIKILNKTLLADETYTYPLGDTIDESLGTIQYFIDNLNKYMDGDNFYVSFADGVTYQFIIIEQKVGKKVYKGYGVYKNGEETFSYLNLDELEQYSDALKKLL